MTQFRVGIGHDIHRLGASRPLILGGVGVPSDSGLHGHSDADVVLHAVCDALLGAAGMGDIGELFPDSDPQWKNMPSRIFVREVLGRIRLNGWRVENVDVMVHAERPKLGPRKQEMRAAIAQLLEIDAECVGVKAGTNEGQDAVGRGEAIACSAVALLRREAGGAIS
ncbi:MAG: 2-C-methyl-D-erythritol 2,4-cyclodiphosphate synthase [Phycisphaerales bacterium]|nr:2-C-methyl-D-erythritol 2,4-cyclodiphosphate synthase [Phycisphaerales bacterium]